MKMIRKYVYVIMCVLLFSTVGLAQTIYNSENATIAWDAVAKPTCPTGSTVSATCPGPTFPMTAVGTVKYKIFKRTDLVSTGTYTNQEVTVTQAVVHFSPGVTEFVGVESEFYGAATPTVAQPSATKAWSNVAADCQGGSMFGFLYTVPLPGPNKPGNLRISLYGLMKGFRG